MFHRLLSPTLQPFMTTMMLLLLLWLCLRLVESFLLGKSFVLAEAVLQTQALLLETGEDFGILAV